MVTSTISGSMLANQLLSASPPASSLLPSGRWRPASKTKGWSMGSDRICYHMVGMSTASLLLVAGCCRIRIQLTNTMHFYFCARHLSHAARCSIAANFDDAGTGLITRFFMCIVVCCSFLLLRGHSHFCRYRSIASILRIFFILTKKSLHLPMGIVVGKGAGYFGLR